jgi:hypothetical protein
VSEFFLWGLGFSPEGWSVRGGQVVTSVIFRREMLSQVDLFVAVTLARLEVGVTVASGREKTVAMSYRGSVVLGGLAVAARS